LASDQNAGESGINISFFNKPASIPKGAAKFHLKTGVPILVGFCILSEDYQYSLSLKSLDTNNLDEDEGEAIKQINTRFSNLLEDAIRQNPEQYFWYHRRWPKKIYA
jgi:KDO2-lipid IV(A) lauroyltransferase